MNYETGQGFCSYKKIVADLAVSDKLKVTLFIGDQCNGNDGSAAELANDSH